MGEDMDIALLPTFVMTLSKQVNDNLACAMKRGNVDIQAINQ